MASPINTPPEERAKALAESIRLSLRLERKFAPKVKSLLQQVYEAAAAALKNTASLDEALRVAEAAKPALTATLGAQWGKVGAVFGDRVFDALVKQGLSEARLAELADVFIGSMNDWIAHHVGTRVKEITETTLGSIRAAVFMGAQAGAGIEETARQIRKLGSEFSSLRARMIARTETHNSASFAQRAVVDATWYQYEGEWGSAEDDRTRPSHRKIDGSRVKQGELYRVPVIKKGVVVGYDELRHPGDPDAPPRQTVGCRCTEYFHMEYSDGSLGQAA